jgi:hypothetical protein
MRDFWISNWLFVRRDRGAGGRHAYLIEAVGRLADLPARIVSACGRNSEQAGFSLNLFSGSQTYLYLGIALLGD